MRIYPAKCSKKFLKTELFSSQLSKFSHGDTLWLSAGSNEEINYVIVLYRTTVYFIREYAD